MSGTLGVDTLGEFLGLSIDGLQYISGEFVTAA